MAQNVGRTRSTRVQPSSVTIAGSGVERPVAELAERRVAELVQAVKVWKTVKNRLPLFGTRPFFRIVSGSMRTSTPSGNPEKSLNAWLARMLRSARNRMRG